MTSERFATSSDLLEAESWLADHTLEPSERCGRHEPLPLWSWRPRIHDYDLWMVRGGRGRAQLDGLPPVDLAAGTLLLLRPGDHGEIVQDERAPVSVTFCHFEIRRGGSAVTMPAALTPRRVHHLEPGGPTAGHLEALVRSMTTVRPFARLRAGAHLAHVLAGVYALPRRDRRDHDGELGRRAVEMIDAAPERRLTAAAVAARLDVTPREVPALVRAQTGMSFREYALESRLRRAQVLVGETDLPVASIARMLGYADHTLLSKQFRARFGSSPRSYRQP